MNIFPSFDLYLAEAPAKLPMATAMVALKGLQDSFTFLVVTTKPLLLAAALNLDFNIA